MADVLKYTIRLDAETQGLRRANDEYLRFIGSIKAGVGIDIGGRLVESVNGMVEAMKAGAMAGVEFNSKLQDLAVSYRTLLGSSELAQLRIADLADFAAKTPFELPGVGQANKILQTLTNGALASLDGMRLVGDAAAVADRPIEELAMHIGRLYDGLMSGREVGHSIMELQRLGIISGETRNKIEAMQKVGEKGPAVWNVAKEALSRFSGEMENRSKTLSGRMSTLRDAWNAAMGEMMAGATGAATSGAEDLANALAKPETVQALREIGVQIRQITESMAKMAVWAAENADKLKELVTVVMSLAKAWAAVKIGNIALGGLQSLAGAGGAAAAGAGGKAAAGAGAAGAGGLLGGPVAWAAMAAVVANDQVNAYANEQEAAAATANAQVKVDNDRLAAVRQQMAGLDSVAAKKTLILDLEQQIAAAQQLGNAGLAAKLGRIQLELKAVDETVLAAKEKAAAEKKAAEEAEINAKVNRKALDKMNVEIAQDKGAFMEKFQGADRAEQIDLARQYIGELRKEQEANNPEKFIGGDQDEFKEKAARYKALYSEITSWQQRLNNLQKADERETAQARKATLRDLRGQSYNDLLSGASADQRVGLLSSGARRVIEGGAAANAKGPMDAQTLEKIRAGIDKLVELNKDKEDASGLWAD